jgi:hypothetical protein
MSSPPERSKPHGAGIEVLAPDSMPLTVEYAPRVLTMHTLTEVELDTVAGLSNSVHLAFLGISAGAFVAFVITLATVAIEDPRTAATLSALTGLSAVLSLYFGVRAITDFRSSRQKLAEIKRGGRARF